MRSRKILEDRYGVLGADLIEACPGTRIAMEGNDPFHVHFGGNKLVTDRTLSIVAQMTRLVELVANGTSITDRGLVEIRILRNLSALHLNETAITDRGLNHIGDLPLCLLDLGRTGISDAGLEILAKMTTIRELYLVNSGCTATGVRKLRAQLPDCDN